MIPTRHNPPTYIGIAEMPWGAYEVSRVDRGLSTYLGTFATAAEADFHAACHAGNHDTEQAARVYTHVGRDGCAFNAGATDGRGMLP